MKIQKKIVNLLLMLFICIGSISAQNRVTVSGLVRDASTNESLVGVNILVQGTTNGTITDSNGKYVLKNVPAKGNLVFSYIGMKSITVPVNGRSNINVNLESETSNLNEIVVVGYGTAKSKDLTGAISTVKASEISSIPSSSPMGALQGKITGIQVTNTGVPGGSPTVRVRGVGTFDSQYEGPLYVVDGMFFDNIDFLDNNNIESVTVLKDASAAAIYGVRAANGVILITTRNGIKGETHITYDGYVGFQRATHKVKMANSAQYAAMMQEAGQLTNIDASVAKWGGSGHVPSTDTDWYDELLETGYVQSHSLNISGASDKGSYLLGISFYGQDGIMKVPSNYNRYNIISKGDYNPFSWLKVGANITVSNGYQRQATEEAFRCAFITPSIVPVYDKNNTAAFPIDFASPGDAGFVNGYFANPVAKATYYNNKIRSLRVLPSVYAEVSLIPNKLKYRFGLSQEYFLNRTSNYTPMDYVYTEQKNQRSILTKTDDYYYNTIIDNVLTYTNNFGKHNLTAMVGQSSRLENYRMLNGTVKDLTGSGESQYMYLKLGAADTRLANDDGYGYRGLSYFGRVSYDYDGKYLASVTFRADGSSKYQQKWGYFPSVGLGWVISEENFMKDQKVFDFLKLRASWGKLGNDKVPASTGFAGIDNAWYVAMNNQLYPGLVYKSTFSWLKWEVVEETNLGLSFKSLQNRLSGDVNYYTRKTKNAVVDNTIAITGDVIKANSGEIKNSGFEIELNWKDKIGDLNYEIGVNATTLRNRVTSIQGKDISYLYTGTAENRQIMSVGHPMNSYYGYQVAGIYQNDAEVAADPIAVANGFKPGYLRYVDQDNSGTLDDKDRTILGNPYPKFTYGGNIGLEYKNFDFSMSVYGVGGVKIDNAKMGFRNYASTMNFTDKYAKNHWSTTHASTKNPSVEGLQKASNGQLNGYFIQSGNFFQIQNIQLGYTAKKLFNLVDAHFYLSANQPFSFYSYDGFTPQVASGLDTQTYPMTSTYTIGMKITY
jgi:TonB-linked SusC/RagA family outer membrane protein